MADATTHPRRRSAGYDRRGPTLCIVTSADFRHHVTRGGEIPLGINLGRPKLVVAEYSLGGFQAKTMSDTGRDGMTKLVGMPPMCFSPRFQFGTLLVRQVLRGNFRELWFRKCQITRPRTIERR